MTIIWKEIPGHIGYEASFCGQVRSLDRVSKNINGVTRLLRGKLLTPTFDKLGYARVSITLGNVRKSCVHYLVAITWVGPKPDAHSQVRHLDGNPRNCVAINLRWGTPTENSADSFVHGTAAIGEKHGRSILTNADVIEIRKELKIKTKQSDIAKKFGICGQTITNIKTGKQWSHIS